MAINVECPKCDRKISAPDERAGARVKCPQCGAPVIVPRPFSESLAGSVADIERRPCPQCGQSIAAAATKCRFCQASFTIGPPSPANSEPTRVVITDVQIPFERAVYLVGFWWAASLVFGVAIGIIIGLGMMILAAVLRGAAGA